jgi:hypothetical protein
MPFNINTFKTNIRDYGYLDNNSFAVLVQPPPALSAGLSTSRIAQNMSFRIDQVRAPGINLMTNDINRYGIGPTQKQVTSAQFQDIYFSVLCDHYAELWQFWYEWTRFCFQYNGTANGQGPSFTAEYKQNYSSTVIIEIYDHYGNVVQSINLFEAYPTSLREIPLAYGDGNLMKLNVAMTYTEYTIEKNLRRASQQRTGGEAPNRIGVDRVNIA